MKKTPGVLIQRVYCKRVKTLILLLLLLLLLLLIIIIIIIIITCLTRCTPLMIKINTTTVNVFASSVNSICSVALLIDSSDRQNKHDVPYNGDRVATALATHWILPVRGEVFRPAGTNGRRYLTKERTGEQKQQQM
jgi:hypothetical protein